MSKSCIPVLWWYPQVWYHLNWSYDVIPRSHIVSAGRVHNIYNVFLNTVVNFLTLKVVQSIIKQQPAWHSLIAFVNFYNSGGVVGLTFTNQVDVRCCVKVREYGGWEEVTYFLWNFFWRIVEWIVIEVLNEDPRPLIFT